MKSNLSLLIIILFITISCRKSKIDNFEKFDFLFINQDTLFEKKIPLLKLNTIHNDIFDRIINNEKKCVYYKEISTCFGIRCQIVGGDTLLYIHSIDYFLTNFSEDMENLDENYYGCIRYKGFSFFCLKNCEKYTNFYHETSDSITIKNSIFLYMKLDPYIDDSHSIYNFFIRNDSLIKHMESICTH